MGVFFEQNEIADFECRQFAEAQGLFLWAFSDAYRSHAKHAASDTNAMMGEGADTALGAKAREVAAEGVPLENVSPEGVSSRDPSSEASPKEAGRMNTPTTLRDGGGQATVTGIAEVTEAGGVIVTLADGRHVPVEALTFSDPKAGAVYQAGRNFNREGAAALVGNYDGKAKPAVYVARFRQFYQAALRGIPYESIRQVSDSRRGLSLAAQKAAYAAGESAAKLDIRGQGVQRWSSRSIDPNTGLASSSAKAETQKSQNYQMSAAEGGQNNKIEGKNQTSVEFDTGKANKNSGGTKGEGGEKGNHESVKKTVNFLGVKDLDDFKTRLPSDAEELAWRKITGRAKEGVSYRWTDAEGSTWGARAHSHDPSAPVGSNSYNGWVYRVSVRWGGKGKKYFMDSFGNFHPENVLNPASPMYDEEIANDAHIMFDNR